MTSKLILVAGAAGFIGSHLCDRLIGTGHRVLALDNLSTGHLRHLADLQRHPRFRYMQADITQPLPRAALRAEAIFNLACPASPAYYQRHPVATLQASTLGTWRLLELCGITGARLLQASTSEVYGDPQVHPQHEGYWGHVNPIGPRACYDEGKRAAEAMCFSYAAERGAQVRVARLFNCYGPRLRPGDGRVVSNFVTQALAGQPLSIYGDGLQTRSFCYVDDTVRALLALMDADTPGPLNIGNPLEHTMLELAQRVLQLTGSHSTLSFHPLPVDDPVRRRPDISAARAALNWQPAVTLQEGLQDTIDYFLDLAVSDGAGALMPSRLPAGPVTALTPPSAPAQWRGDAVSMPAP